MHHQCRLWTFILFSALHFIGEVGQDILQDIVWFREYHSGMEVEGIKMTFTLFIGVNLMTIAELVLYLTTAVLTFMGIRRRIKSLSFIYPFYVAMDIRMWYGNIGNYMMVNDYLSTGISVYMTLSSIAVVYAYKRLFDETYRRRPMIRTFQLDSDHAYKITV
ncbi:unnamed protein product, partial [Mesorhabditis spiculigera]